MLIGECKKITHDLESYIRNSDCVFFVGAGISMVSPSKLPSGNELKDFVIECLFDNYEFASHYEKIKLNSKFQEIVPEVLFQDLYDILRNNLFLIYKILEKTNPNKIHKILASFSNNYQIRIFTTNFDLLIDPLLNIPSSITHLHGRLDKPSDMSILIKQIVRGMSSKFQKEFQEAVIDKNLFILGYSGNDKDIIDLINSSRPKSVFWMMRNIKDEWVLRNLKALNKSNIQIFQGELNSMFESLSQDFEIEEMDNFYTNTTYDLAGTIKTEIQNKLNEYEKFALLKLVYYRLQEYEFARHVCKIVLDKFDHNSYPYKLWLWFVIHYCDCEIITSEDLSIGHQFMDSALNSRQTNKNPFEKGMLNNMKGLFYLDCKIPDLDKAIHFFNKAKSIYLKLLETENDSYLLDDIKDCLGKSYNNFGYSNHLLKRFGKAFKYYSQSLKYKRAIGDMFGQTTTMANIAIAYFELNNTAKYNYWKRKAEAFMEKYNQFYRRGYFKKEIGILLIKKGKIRKGKKYLEEAIDVFNKYVSSALNERIEIESYLSRY